jgi:phosphate transport system permease protein
VPRRLSDRLGIVLAYVTGLSLLGLITALMIWLGVNGLSHVSWDFLTTPPAPGSLEHGVNGGISDIIIGTLICIVLGIVVALPLGLGTAIFLTEYGRPRTLARLADTGVDMIFGVPSIVFALFGLAIFIYPKMIFLSSEVGSSGQATGQSFLCASLILSLIALPPIVRASESALNAVPRHQREASFALGKGRLATIRRVVVPAARPGIMTGAILGIGRMIGDTAIAWLLLGGTVLAPLPKGALHPENIVDTLRGTGATLTTYIYYASPVGEGNTYGAAYGAAFVLMVLIVVINALVRSFGRRKGTGTWR